MDPRCKYPWMLTHPQVVCWSISPLSKRTSSLQVSSNIRSELFSLCISRARRSRFWVHSFFFCRHFDAATRLRSKNFERRASSGLLGSKCSPPLANRPALFLRTRFGGARTSSIFVDGDCFRFLRLSVVDLSGDRSPGSCRLSWASRLLGASSSGGVVWPYSERALDGSI